MSRPSVSVVIPTIGRDHVFRAVESVLAQTEAVREILVVADTVDDFALPDDPRIRLMRVGPFAGGNTARQAGIQAATGDVIGLLDDDDEWLPDKIRQQLNAVERNSAPVWVATSRVLMRRSSTETLVQPERALADGENLLHYMFRKSAPRAGHGFIQASTLLFPRALALEVEFDRTLKFHQDISWLVDVVAAHPEVTVLQVWDPLVTYHSTEGSVSKKIDPAGSIAWARKRLSGDRRTQGDFILTQSFGFARRSGSLRSMLGVVATGVRTSRPSASAVVYALGATAKAALRRDRAGRDSSTSAAEAASPVVPRSRDPRTRVMMSPASSVRDDNPFVSLLVDNLPDDIVVAEFSWKRAFLSRYDVLHIHWPEHILRSGSPGKTRVKELLFLLLLARNRFAARHVRTVHNVRPHEGGTPLNRFVLRRWERSCDASVYLSEAGRLDAVASGQGRGAITIPHGDYLPFIDGIGVELHDPVPGRLLAFGYLRPYKGIEQLVTALAGTDVATGLSLQVSGNPLPQAYGEELLGVVQGDERIRLRLGRVGDRELLEEIQLAEAVVLPYRQVYNSGAALLALSAGRPIIVTESATMRELGSEVGEGWVRLVDEWTPDRLVTATTGLPGPDDRPDLSARSWPRLSAAYASLYRGAVAE